MLDWQKYSRLTILASILFPLGAVIALMVALFCAAAFSPYASLARGREVSEPLLWETLSGKALPPNCWEEVHSGFGREKLLLLQHDGSTSQLGEYHRTGWPMYMLVGSWITDRELGTSEKNGLLDLARWQKLYELIPNSQIPIRPLWPAFAINTIFYGVILWMLFIMPFAWRRWRRIRRGLCTKCGYDLRTSSELGCPECGWNRG